MKEITLKVSDKVFSELKSSLGIRTMCGNAYGIQDAVISKLLRSLEANDSELELVLKEEKENAK